MTATIHKWTFAPRFRRNSFGWQSQPAIKRIKEAMAEIKKVAKKDKALAAEGAVTFIEKLVPAIVEVDSSSGAIGAAVYGSLTQLAQLISKADVEDTQRDQWLKRLWASYEADEYGYLDNMGDHWGTLCGSPAIASQWADSFTFQVRRYWQEKQKRGNYYNGVVACLSSLLAAGRHQDLLDLIKHDPSTFWPHRRYGFLALAALGKNDEALQHAEQCRSPNDEQDIDRDCENLLISIGEVEQAYQKYAMHTNESNTRINTFRAIAKKYPDKDKAEILMDLIGSTPGSEGKWFATARKLGFYDLALRLAQKSPCDPKTLNRAARDTVESDPQFALGISKASLHWLCEGWGYEITRLDVLELYQYILKSAKALDLKQQVIQEVNEMVIGAGKDGKFVKDVLGRHLS
jgi:hypothetical protein